MASCTKLLTSIAALQCVDQNLIKLDEDVAEFLPELARLEILQNFDKNGKPRTVKRKNPITLRLLLSHSSGLAYDGFSPKLMRYRQSVGQRVGAGSTLVERYTTPLLFEPGTSWSYGPSVDWAGRLVERLTNKSLEDYFKENIFKPLGIRDITFWIDKRPDMQARLSDMTSRDPFGSGTAVPWRGKTINTGITECLGGQGCYATIPEYTKVLHSLLSDDERLLKKETAAEMFSPQLSVQAKKFLVGLRHRPEIWVGFPGEFPPHIELDHGLGGIITMSGEKGGRGKGTLIWSGLPNLVWFIDREIGLCGMIGLQLVPAGDAACRALTVQFEKAMYERSKSSAKL